MKEFKNITVGVLALQGDFSRHLHQLALVGAKARLVRLPVDLECIDGLIIPGGESTTIDKLIDRFGLRAPLTEFGRSQPVWGTCAGMIMLAQKIKDNQAGVKPLGLMDIDVKRMGYGRQVFSFEDNLTTTLNGTAISLKATFIRAPVVTRAGQGVITLARHDNEPVLVSEKNLLASSFHTELDDDTTLLAYFLKNFFSA